MEVHTCSAVPATKSAHRRFVAYEMPVATRISRVQVESGNCVEGFGAQLCLGLTNNETHSLTNLMRDVIAQESNH